LVSGASMKRFFMAGPCWKARGSKRLGMGKGLGARG
jgi:hypothetical protein